MFHVALHLASSEEPVCRYCYDPTSLSHPLITPCLCKGSIEFAHKKCVLRWIDVENEFAHDGNISVKCTCCGCRLETKTTLRIFTKLFLFLVICLDIASLVSLLVWQRKSLIDFLLGLAILLFCGRKLIKNSIFRRKVTCYGEVMEASPNLSQVDQGTRINEIFLLIPRTTF
ncbi:hypothetical protein L596_012001 [Steinernema carpocapsae]|uniref:RING-CH-type domain-containing protein n=1 Tax=Steinernema carpocapsae TaxID=34508 RepID=A0A4U5NWJ1_STECR|nr:hypothetical protein L596_012001 [Steinernema carpocapsae]